MSRHRGDYKTPNKIWKDALSHFQCSGKWKLKLQKDIISYLPVKQNFESTTILSIVTM